MPGLITMASLTGDLKRDIGFLELVPYIDAVRERYAMITTVTMNASVDKLYQVDEVQLSTVMRVKNVVNTPGGKGLNVARVISHAGEAVRAIGLLGGFNGAYIRSMLQERGILEDFTDISGETRSCINVLDSLTGEHTEFLEPGANVSGEEFARFMLSYEQALQTSDVIAVSGSVPGGTPAGFYGKLVLRAKALQKQIILDTSGELLKDGIKSKPTMIKPNHEELAQLIGKAKCTRREIVQAAKQIHSQGIDYVVVSFGRKGSLLVCDQGVFQASPPEIIAANTVGCGDSMVAGLAIGLARQMEPLDMLQYATAISAASAMSPFTGHFCRDDFDSILPRVKVQREE